MISITVSLVVTALAVMAIVALDHDQATRRKVVDVQGQARDALSVIERDLRHAALGVGSGVVWGRSGANRAARPAVQIFSTVPGGGLLDAKPGTDALLVVGASRAPGQRAAVVGDLGSSTGVIPVTDASTFAAGTPVLLGDYGDASWGVLQTVTSSGSVQQVTFADAAVNVLPGQQVQRLGAGSILRAASARLYYVTAADDLVRLDLAVPRSPTSAAEAVGRTLLARGIENVKLTCQLDDQAGGFQACPAAISTAEDVSTESAIAWGAFTAGQGPVLTAANVGLLRTVTIDLVARSQTPVLGGVGDPRIALAGGALPVGGGDDSAAYVRRAYRVVAAVRNTSLGTF
jgi:hypothetical protein